MTTKDSLIARLRKRLTLREDTDAEMTVESIYKSVEFKGINIWILACAIIVASVGLNVNSTAVIIGAMLISPLMGPINGMGLAVGINDSQLLRKSLSNLAIMVLISLVVSMTYFFISPLSDARSELLARTTPTIFDVFIAFFGGMAGIIAISRKQQAFAVISGVAIATALMPPLCTTGFFIACGQFGNAFGAFYLFFINSFFIALATFVAVSYILHLPKKKYIDPHRATIVKRMITLFSVVVIVPSVFMAIHMIRESSFQTQAIRYIDDIEQLDIFQKTHILNVERKYSRKEQRITLSVIGKELTPEEINLLESRLTFFKLKNTKLTVKQLNENTADIDAENKILLNILTANERQMAQKDSIIQQLEHKEGLSIPETLVQEVRLQYPELGSVAIANMVYIHPDTGKTDTVPTVHLTWKQQVTAERQQNLVEWLKLRLGIKEIMVL